MTSNTKMRDFIQAEFAVAKKYSNIQPEVTFLLANEIISEAKMIRKNIINQSFPAYYFDAHKDGVIRRFAVQNSYTLPQCIKIVIGARYFYMSYNNLKDYMSHV